MFPQGREGPGRDANDPSDMTARRLPVAVPLGVLVAVLAHLAGFGFGHAPGGPHATELLQVLGSALLLVLLCGFFGALLRPASVRRLLGAKGDVSGLLLLAVTGFAAYALIELAEGHFTLAGALRGLLYSLPAAALVGLAARAVARVTGRAARRFAGYARSRALGTLDSFVPVTSVASRLRTSPPWVTWRGRAPPRFA